MRKNIQQTLQTKQNWRVILDSLQVATWIFISALFGIWKLIVFAATYLATLILPNHPGFSSYKETTALKLPYFWQVMSNFDGQHYLEIAQRGYTPLTQAFFPLYPLVIELLARNLHIPF